MFGESSLCCVCNCYFLHIQFMCIELTSFQDSAGHYSEHNVCEETCNHGESQKQMPFVCYIWQVRTMTVKNCMNWRERLNTPNEPLLHQPLLLPVHPVYLMHQCPGLSVSMFKANCSGSAFRASPACAIDKTITALYAPILALYTG